VVKDELRSGPPNRASGHRQPDYKHVTPSGVQTDSRRYLTIEFFKKIQRTLLEAQRKPKSRRYLN